ncbi:MAG TPA: two-component regulator propeller domain-containing protein [Bacteroidia bacterium]|jgi:ligand-binding sensor domain-containing protein/serine phosphatase RsbU (regulator of sigma subunit)
MLKAKLHFLLFLFVLTPILLLGQQYNFKNYSTKNGLANSTVNNIFQDSKGFIWFATQGGGLSRFDGKTFKNFNKSNGLPSNEITCVTEDHSGNIWIASFGGVSRFDGMHFFNYGKAEGIDPKEGIYWIIADQNNEIWIAIRGGGVARFNGKKFTFYTTDDGLLSNSVFSIVEDKKKNLWFTMANGIMQFNGKKFITYSNTPQFKKKTFFSSFVDSRGRIWFGSVGGGVLLYNGKTFQDITLPTEVKDDFIGSITEDKKGNIWLATEHGALKLEKDKFHLFTEQQGLSANGILSVASDYEGNIWIGTQDGGINLFNNESFVNFREKDGLVSKSLAALYRDKDNLILGTPGTGLNFYNIATNTFTVSSGIKEIDQLNVFSIISDNDKNLWIGAKEGVFVLKPENGRYKLIPQSEKFKNENIKAAVRLIKDHNGDIWVATFGSGIYRIKGDQITKFDQSNGLSTDNIITIFEDSHHMIWIGTKDAGLIRFDGKTFKNYGTAEGMTDKAIWSLTEDNNGILYIGTGESGIYCFDGKKFHSFSTKNGLCSNYVPAVLFDTTSNCLWLGTDKGINKISFGENFKIASLWYYGEQEGYKGLDVNQNAIVAGTNGDVFFATVNGLSKYTKKYDIPNMTPPKLVLLGIKMDYKVVDWSKIADSVDAGTGLPYKLTLSHLNNNLIFDFQALTTNNVVYSYKLEGQDTSWTPLSSNTEAVFTNIEPGRSYTFKVKALSSNGVWSRDAIAYTFSIHLPWWKTGWFFAGIALLVAAAIFTFVIYRVAQLAKEKKVLEVKVVERTRELSLAFQEIKDSILYAKKIQDAILPLKEEIKEEFPNSFVLYKPKHVVSGDFYWMNTKDDKVYLAAVDCTGHGVPGAFMSMIGSSLLNEIILKKGDHNPATVLTLLHKAVRKSLKQNRSIYESKDGMDLSLIVIDKKAGKLQFAGAKRPLYFFTNGVFTEIKADKQSIGGLEMEDDYQFTNHDVKLNNGDTFYLFTDGFVDQFGGDKEKKYSSKRFQMTLNEMQHLPLEDQGRLLNKTLASWKEKVEQIDDILVIGIRF